MRPAKLSIVRTGRDIALPTGTVAPPEADSSRVKRPEVLLPSFDMPLRLRLNLLRAERHGKNKT